MFLKQDMKKRQDLDLKHILERGEPMGSRVIGVSCILAFLLVIPSIAMGADWKLGDWGSAYMKGEATYAFRLRTEAQDPALAGASSGGDNFDKGDFGNNKLVGTLELTIDSENVTFFGRVVGFLDFEYFDDDKFSNDVQEHAAYNATDSLEFYLEGRTGRFTTRWGRQVLQWGEALAAPQAPGVNVLSPWDLSKVGQAGFTLRSAQIPTWMAWGSYSVSEGLAFEAVWAPDFDPRYYFPTVGTFASTSDLLGWGAPCSIQMTDPMPVCIDVDDRRPKDWVDQQQYGGAMRMVIQELNQMDLGFYYYHYRSRAPLATMDWAIPNLLPATIIFEWPEVDMIGMSFAQAIQQIGNWNFDWQIGGELAWRPNDPLQTADSSGFIRSDTLSWNINFMKIMSDVFAFTPWTFSFTPMIEFYGKAIVDYDEEVYAESWLTGYYWVQLPLAVEDMISNTKVNLGFSANGAMHREYNNQHSLGFTASAKYGIRWGAAIGYTIRLGSENQDPTGRNQWDRDNFDFSISYYF
jgi:hypothetical protein